MLTIRFNFTLHLWGVLRGNDCCALFECLKDAIDYYHAALLRN